MRGVHMKDRYLLLLNCSASQVLVEPSLLRSNSSNILIIWRSAVAQAATRPSLGCVLQDL